MLIVISVVLTVLKLAGIIAWSWSIVLIPAFVSALFFIVVLFLSALAFLLGAWKTL